MATLHGKEIKTGDKVWHIRLGWFKVSKVLSSVGNTYSIVVGNFSYSNEGKEFIGDLNPSIYWEEMILTPKPEPVYEWQWLCWNKVSEGYCATSDYYKDEPDALAAILPSFKSRPLIRIEESKREVK